MAKKVANVNELEKGLRADVAKMSKSLLGQLAEHIKTVVVGDYRTRVQRDNYPLRNPITKEEMESMPPSEIAKFVTKTVMPDRAMIYIKPGIPAHRSGRMQELYGGKPWQRIRSKMQTIDYANRVLAVLGLKGVKAKSTV